MLEDFRQFELMFRLLLHLVKHDPPLGTRSLVIRFVFYPFSLGRFSLLDLIMSDTPGCLQPKDICKVKNARNYTETRLLSQSECHPSWLDKVPRVRQKQFGEQKSEEHGVKRRTWVGDMWWRATQTANPTVQLVLDEPTSPFEKLQECRGIDPERSKVLKLVQHLRVVAMTFL